ncbi:MAG: hypothetical protein A3G32_02875 [Deltaproteobacteria bacterium RIFCSPLOWO2_12_FULL_40_28]|nr:MAG: hypothetical protein A3C45_00255 [Deltaproteobacteria bacterium RIFCSPHIGHO2_02_FULL_40_28]OGQ20059.1 MAG: hypothetical protein A3E27_02920 [Deltaproteobacteria bacterium RIFCSPHIGHO2_12_FULL_40_32]OGQ40626.1 MAG: hypothetical protein A3I69_10345 [Deltaproteobacteria bacterium RIFCSPLOWO2_02_FULL_40_36]OGQ54295.1 MAG: hypothetical protein A3G32_02875 [Deltaproteobacteria bacterium RIFCSPLOWO2_12_FULL_40_28]
MLFFNIKIRQVVVFGLMGLFIFTTACLEEGKRRPVSSGNVDGELNRCLSLASRKKYEDAVECLEIFKSRYPSGDKAASADLLIADSYFRKKDYLVAAEAYQEFLRQYPTHAKAAYAYFQSGLSYLRFLPKSIARNQEHLDLAIKNLALVVEYYPDSDMFRPAQHELHRALGRMAARDYYIARFYYRFGEYKASILRFEEIVTKYPGVGYDEKSFYYLVLAHIRSGQIDQARRASEIFADRFPRSPLAKKMTQKVSQVSKKG